MSEHSYSLRVGSMLLEHRIERVLGHGGFGITYLARDTLLEEAVAIKEYLPNELALRDSTNTVKPKSTDDDEVFRWGLQAFISEARTIARFRHPNIMRVRRFFEANGTGYLVMDFAEGATFDKWLKANPVAEASLRTMLLALLDGLAVVHAAGVLHRDIKPGNIIVRPDDSPLLIDFGAARDIRTRLSRSLTAIVTAGYAPLEQYGSSSAQGPWSDLYALGAVAYRAITGKAPPEAVTRIRKDPMVPALDAGKGKFSPDFLRIIDWALSPDERDRPQSAAEMRDALSGKTRPAPRAKTASGGGDRRLLVAMIAFLVLVATGGGIGYIAFGSNAHRSAEAPTTKPDTTGLVPVDRMTVTVDAAGTADAPTIARALELAASGATVHVRPGRYAEALTLDKPVTIEGDVAHPEAVRVESPSGPAVAIHARGVVLRGMTLTATEDCLIIAAESVTVDNVSVSSTSGTAITVKERADPALRYVSVPNAGAYGLSIEGHAAGTYTEVSISHTGDAGVRILDSADPVVQKLEVADTGGAGLLFARGGKGRFTDTKVRRATLSSVEVADDAAPTIEDSELSDGKQSGLFIRAGGGGIFRNNVLTGHGYAQIAIDGETRAIISDNTLSHGQSEGIYVTHNGRADFDSNTVKDNLGHGVVVDFGSAPRLLRNRLSGNKAPQILTSASAHPDLAQNIVDVH